MGGSAGKLAYEAALAMFVLAVLLLAGVEDVASGKADLWGLAKGGGGGGGTIVYYLYFKKTANDKN